MAWWSFETSEDEEDIKCIEQCKVVAEHTTKTTNGLVELKDGINEKLKDDIDDNANLQKIVVVIDDILNCIEKSDILKDIKTIAEHDKK